MKSIWDQIPTTYETGSRGWEEAKLTRMQSKDRIAYQREREKHNKVLCGTAHLDGLKLALALVNQNQKG